MTDGKKDSDFTARPINLTASIGSRLKQSFAQINRSTPVESISGESLLKEEDETIIDPDDYSRKNRRNAMIAGASVAGGAILFATVLIGGTFLATSNDCKLRKVAKIC